LWFGCQIRGILKTFDRLVGSAVGTRFVDRVCELIAGDPMLKTVI
jgi:hypothetical protein